jgi:hypothetical protein
MPEPYLIREMLLISIIFSPIILSVILLSIIWSGNTDQENLSLLKQTAHEPCGHCIYFTGSHHLTCTVHPQTALTAEAINCFDFQSAATLRSSRLKRSEYSEH